MRVTSPSVTTGPPPIGLLAERFPPGLVAGVVAAEGAHELRRRRLPAPLMVYLNLALWLRPGLGYAAVLDELLAVLPPRCLIGARQATSTSIAAARVRLGPDVMRRLFAQFPDPVAAGGGREWVVAPIRVAVPASPDNRLAFGDTPLWLRMLVCRASGFVGGATWTDRFPAGIITPGDRLIVDSRAGGGFLRGAAASGALVLTAAPRPVPLVEARSRGAEGVVAELWSLLCLRQARISPFRAGRASRTV